MKKAFGFIYIFGGMTWFFFLGNLILTGTLPEPTKFMIGLAFAVTAITIIDEGIQKLK